MSDEKPIHHWRCDRCQHTWQERTDGRRKGAVHQCPQCHVGVGQWFNPQREVKRDARDAELEQAKRLLEARRRAGRAPNPFTPEERSRIQYERRVPKAERELIAETIEELRREERKIQNESQSETHH